MGKLQAFAASQSVSLNGPGTVLPAHLCLAAAGDVILVDLDINELISDRASWVPQLQSHTPIIASAVAELSKVRQLRFLVASSSNTPTGAMS